MDFLTTHAALLNVSARLLAAGHEHDFGTVEGAPALVGEGFTVTRDGAGYMVDTFDVGAPVALCDDVVRELGMAGV